MVSHRLSHIEHYDNIFVLHNGEILIHGKHEYLKEHSEYYRDLMQI